MARPSAWMVRARVDQAAGAIHWMNGGRRMRRGAGAPVAAGRLHEPDPAVADLGRGPNVEGHRREGQVARAEPQGGAADQAAAGVAVADDAAILDLDPGAQLVGEPKRSAS